MASWDGQDLQDQNHEFRSEHCAEKKILDPGNDHSILILRVMFMMVTSKCSHFNAQNF